MRIKITETIDVDAELWAEAYGLDLDEVREDVKHYFNGYIQAKVDQLNLHTRYDANEPVGGKRQ